MKLIIFLCTFTTFSHEAMNNYYQLPTFPIVFQQTEEIYYQHYPWLIPLPYSFEMQHNNNINVAPIIAYEAPASRYSNEFEHCQTTKGLYSEEIELERLKKIVAEGGNLNVQDKHGDTPLMRAAMNFWIPVVKFLLEHNADISCKNRTNSSFKDLLDEPSQPDALFAKRYIYQFLYQNALKKQQKRSRGKKVSFTEEKQ